MEKRRLRRWVLIGLALLACAGIAAFAHARPAEHTRGITLWYAGDDCPEELMEALLARYREETGGWVEGVCFEDEQTLGAAFESGRPDLLFCSHMRAARLDGREKLACVSAPLPVPAKLEGLRPAVGVSFFPVGSRLPLLLVDSTRCSGDFPDWEALCAAAEDEPFVSSDCWAEALYTLCAAAGYEMTGLPAEDGQNARYAALYNSLAEAAFRGGLLAEEHAADRVRMGELPCAVVRSTEIAAIPQGELTLRPQPLPLPEGTEPVYPAELMGFALLGGTDPEAAERFTSWLWQGVGTELAFAAGLVPIADADTGADRGGAFGALLQELAESGPLCWPDAETAFFQNRDTCERDLRETLDLLR